MIRVSDKHKAIFCHIPRTGGTSMEDLLSDWRRVDHTTYGHYHFPGKFIGTGRYISMNLKLDYYIFTIVRNPYDRYLSGLNHTERQTLELSPYWIHEHLIATQTEILGNLKPDYILRLENIKEDIKVIKDRFGIKKEFKHLNRSKGTILDIEIIQHVNEHYADDFINFGYERK